MINWIGKVWTHLRDQARVRDISAIGAMTVIVLDLYAWQAGDLWVVALSAYWLFYFYAGMAKKEGRADAE